MSSEFNVYVGAYFDWPSTIDWNNFIEENEYQDDFILIDQKVISNSNRNTKFSQILADTNRNSTMEINESFIALAQITFSVKTNEIRDKLNEKYEIDPEIKFGVIPYYV